MLFAPIPKLFKDSLHDAVTDPDPFHLPPYEGGRGRDERVFDFELQLQFMYSLLLDSRFRVVT